MKLYAIRHQAAGLVLAHPFASAPSQSEIDVVLAACEARYGNTSKKTGRPLWAKVVSLEDGVETTVGCAHGGTIAEVNARAAGECPIREAGFERWPDAGPADAVSPEDSIKPPAVTARGHVKP